MSIFESINAAVSKYAPAGSKVSFTGAIVPKKGAIAIQLEMDVTFPGALESVAEGVVEFGLGNSSKPNESPNP